jgi:hypothetical protein
MSAISAYRNGDWRQALRQRRGSFAAARSVKPLWEFTVIEGLDGIEGLPKGCYAIVTKVHHACVDGVSGVDMIEAVHDLDPHNPHIRPTTSHGMAKTSPTAELSPRIDQQRAPAVSICRGGRAHDPAWDA